MIYFSLIVPVYNTEKFLARCLDSILKQNPSIPFEVIIVNDGSKDSSLSIAENFRSKFSNIKIISQNNQGLSAARNRGLEEAIGKFVWFIDSDDWISENALDILYKISAKENPDVIQFRAINTDGNNLFSRGKEFGIIQTEVSGKEMFLSGQWQTCAPFYLFNRNFLNSNSLRFFEGIFHEDNEFTPRMLIAAEKAFWINDILYFVYQNPNSITRSFNPKKSFDLIKVCNNLLDFRDEHNMTGDSLKRMNSFICLSLNNALNGILEADKTKKREFSKQLKGSKKIVYCYLKSDSLLYKIEYVWISLFGFLNAYKVIKTFKRYLKH